MARKRLQYQDISRSPFIAAGAIAVFSTFSVPVQAKASVAVESANVVNTPITAAIAVPVFSQFSQPQVSTKTKAYEQPDVTFRIAPPPYTAPTFFGFATFGMVLHAKLPVSVSFPNFAHITPPDPPVQELVDGGYVKKKRKPTKRELEPYVEEAEIKQKRRQAIEEAIYGPPVEYTLPPLAFPPSPPAPPQLGDLPQIIMAAQQRKVIEDRLKQIQDEEDDLEKILREIL